MRIRLGAVGLDHAGRALFDNRLSQDTTRWAFACNTFSRILSLWQNLAPRTSTHWKIAPIEIWLELKQYASDMEGTQASRLGRSPWRVEGVSCYRASPVQPGPQPLGGPHHCCLMNEGIHPSATAVTATRRKTQEGHSLRTLLGICIWKRGSYRKNQTMDGRDTSLLGTLPFTRFGPGHGGRPGTWGLPYRGPAEKKKPLLR